MMADSVLCVVSDRAARADDPGVGGQNDNLIKRKTPQKST
tara:strand:- start:560 stop:679 length:120 start_codon:yes stop_codon:yes gene_type:complete